MKGDKITLRSSRIVYNYPPNYFNEYGAFLVRETSSSGGELKTIVLEDPREFSFENQRNYEQGMMMRDNVDFTVILPFLDMAKTIEIIDAETQKPVHSLDLSRGIFDFCRKVKYADPQCQVSDLDNDGVRDSEDTSPFTPQKRKDSDADGVEDEVDNCPYEYNSDQKDSDGDGVGDACEIETPWWLIILIIILILVLIIVFWKKPGYWWLIAMGLIILLVILMSMLWRIYSSP